MMRRGILALVMLMLVMSGVQAMMPAMGDWEHHGSVDMSEVMGDAKNKGLFYTISDSEITGVSGVRRRVVFTAYYSFTNIVVMQVYANLIQSETDPNKSVMEIYMESGEGGLSFRETDISFNTDSLNFTYTINYMTVDISLNNTTVKIVFTKNPMVIIQNVNTTIYTYLRYSAGRTIVQRGDKVFFWYYGHVDEQMFTLIHGENISVSEYVAVEPIAGAIMSSGYYDVVYVDNATEKPYILKHITLAYHDKVSSISSMGSLMTQINITKIVSICEMYLSVDTAVYINTEFTGNISVSDVGAKYLEITVTANTSTDGYIFILVNKDVWQEKFGKGKLVVKIDGKEMKHRTFEEIKSKAYMYKDENYYNITEETDTLLLITLHISKFSEHTVTFESVEEKGFIISDTMIFVILILIILLVIAILIIRRGRKASGYYYKEIEV